MIAMPVKGSRHLRLLVPLPSAKAVIEGRSSSSPLGHTCLNGPGGQEIIGVVVGDGLQVPAEEGGGFEF